MGYILKSAFYTVVDEEGWAGHVDGVQKTRILSVLPRFCIDDPRPKGGLLIVYPPEAAEVRDV